jgi:nitrite reductase/ring-hydroxylating ferredoxin subunit
MTRLEDVSPLLPVGTIVSAAYGTESVAVIRHSTGWVMVADRCTHAHCPFSDDGEVVDGHVLICNCHGSEFDLHDGAVLVGPADDPLVVTPLVGGEVGVLHAAPAP